MEINPLSNDIIIIENKAVQESKKYFHTFCGTNHLFLALFSFLSQQKSSQTYQKDYNNLKNILNSYNIDGETFEKTFLQFNPKGEAPTAGNVFNISVDPEFKKVIESLKTIAVTQSRQATVEDFILQLFSDRSYALEMIFENVPGMDAPKTNEMYDKIIDVFKKATGANEVKDLEKLKELTNLNKYVTDHPQVVIDADQEIKKMEMALSGRSIKNAALTGPAGCGKTTYVYELAQRINKGEVPDDFKNALIYELDSTALVAGTRYRGDMEERLINIINLVKKNPNVILFIDEFQTFITLGAGTEDASGGGQILKPYITRGEIRIIAATTSEEYAKYILKDKAFASRFHEIKISEPTVEETKKIVLGIIPVEKEFFKRDVEPELAEKVVDLSEKYSLEFANPRKSINMLELACAYAKIFEDAGKPVDVDAVLKSVQLKYDIYISKNKFKDTYDELHKVLLGQDGPLARVCKDLLVVDKGLVNPMKPKFSMILSGSTGVGKTETAKIIAKNYFGSEKALIKINMGEYGNEIDATKLSGASAGFVGYDDEPELITKIKQYPNSVVLFDEVEKAHPSVFKILLNILDTGEMTDNHGNHVSFRNAIIIFTTNLGCDKDTGHSVGAGFIKEVKGQDKREIREALKNFFAPEFLGRVDDIIVYNSLTDDIGRKLIERYREFYVKNSEDHTDIKFSEDDIKEILRNADIGAQGARGLDKAVRSQFVKVLTSKDKTFDVK